MEDEINEKYQSTRCTMCNSDCRAEAENRVGLIPKQGESMLSVWKDLKKRGEFEGSYQSFYFHFTNKHHLSDKDRKASMLREMIESSDDVASIMADFKTIVPGLRLEALYEKEKLKNFTTDEIELLALSNKTKMLQDIDYLIVIRDKLKDLLETAELEKDRVSAARALKDVQKEITETRVKAISELERVISTRRASDLENPDNQPNSKNNKLKKLFENDPASFLNMMAQLNNPDAVIIEKEAE